VSSPSPTEHVVRYRKQRQDKTRRDNGRNAREGGLKWVLVTTHRATSKNAVFIRTNIINGEC